MTPTETAAKLQHFNDWRRGHHDDTAQPDPREIGLAIDAAVEMIERLEDSEQEKERLLGLAHDQNRELVRLREECRALRAKIAEMEKQYPICRIKDIRRAHYLTKVVGLDPEAWLYALPGAQTQGEEK